MRRRGEREFKKSIRFSPLLRVSAMKGLSARVLRFSAVNDSLQSKECPESTFPIRFARRSAPTATSLRVYSRASWNGATWKPCGRNWPRTHWAWRPETVYLGGGTPSAHGPGDLRAHPRRHPRPAPGRKPPSKPLPATITAEKARAWAEAGINRVSLGVQSFVETEIRRTGRKHTAETVARDARSAARRRHRAMSISI